MPRLSSLLLIAALIAAPANAQIMTGPVTVIDGDTLDMTGTRIRLVGIDAPESKQSCTRTGEPWTCGEEATNTLAAIVGIQSITCMAQGTDAYGRTLAICQARALDVGREMVRRGMAVLLDNAPLDYHDAADIAQRMKFGLLGGSFQTPSEWRAANPQTAARIAQQDRPRNQASTAHSRSISDKRHANALGCAIKGNRNRRGEWIYHLPGQAYYEATRPEELFCTEGEAIAAGYRRSKA
jgi:endonuclease YncB( thermonuclease family)